MDWVDVAQDSTDERCRDHSNKHSEISWPDELQSASFYAMLVFRPTNALYRIPFIQRVYFFLCPEHRSRSGWPGECRRSVRQIWGVWCSDKVESNGPSDAPSY
jgi:hypothetical protein